MKTRSHRAAAAVLIPGGAEPPGEIELMPAGNVPTRQHDRRDPWRNTDAAAVIAATLAENGGEFQVNYDHAPGPAAGWVKRLFERAGAIWAEVDWTERAASMIRSKEYRFISPEFLFEEKTRRVRLLTGAALTNDPALYMRAIANTQHQTEEPDMDLEKLRKALGLSDTATEAEILAAASAAAAAVTALAGVTEALGLEKDAEPKAVSTAVSAMAKGRKAVAKAAGLAEDASSDDVEKAVKAAKASAGGDPDPNAFVPRAEFDRVSERVTELETGTARADATAKVDQAIKDGKVAPASKDWAIGYASKDPEGFDKYLEGAPKILEDGRVAPAADPGDGDTLTAEEKAVCRATGLSEEDFIKSRKELAAAGEEG